MTLCKSRNALQPSWGERALCCRINSNAPWNMRRQRVNHTSLLAISDSQQDQSLICPIVSIATQSTPTSRIFLYPIDTASSLLFPCLPPAPVLTLICQIIVLAGLFEGLVPYLDQSTSRLPLDRL